MFTRHPHSPPGPRTSISPSYGNDRVETALELREGVGSCRGLLLRDCRGPIRSGRNVVRARPWAAHPPRREGGHRSARRSRGPRRRRRDPPVSHGLRHGVAAVGRPRPAARGSSPARAGGRDLPGRLWPSGSLSGAGAGQVWQRPKGVRAGRGRLPRHGRGSLRRWATTGGSGGRSRRPRGTPWRPDPPAEPTQP